MIVTRTIRVFDRSLEEVRTATTHVEACLSNSGVFTWTSEKPAGTLSLPEFLVQVQAREVDQLDDVERRFVSLLGDDAWGSGEEDIVDRTVRRLVEAGATVTTAESCTGGLIGALLTRPPGASRAFSGGMVTYSDREKVRQLGVRQRTLDLRGAVSEAVASEMADGALERSGATVAVAVSGVAGPDGGSPSKPVGTVWLATACRIVDPRSPGYGKVVNRTHLITKPGTREQVRERAAHCALVMINQAMGWRL